MLDPVWIEVYRKMKQNKYKKGILNIGFLVILILSVGCEREYSDKPKGNDNRISSLVCSFPNNLKKAVSTELKKQCENTTLKDLNSIKKLKMEFYKGEEDLLTKKHASFFKSLEELDISRNPDLLSLPEFVYYLPHIQKLNMSRTGIKSFPKEISQLKNSLTILIASHNSYENQEIPLEVFSLTNLRVLDFSYSSLRYIDEYIGELYFLKELYLTENSLLILPNMLFSLSHLTIVDLRYNTLYNEKLNAIHSCQNLEEDEKKDCQKDLSNLFQCEGLYELPFQRGEPLRQMYIDIVMEHEDLIIEECTKEVPFHYCPSFFTKCKDHPEYDKDSNEYNRKQCMLDVFESPREDERHRPHRDRCYLAWIGFFVDYDKNPELLNKSVRGVTVRETRYFGRYMNHNHRWYEYCSGRKGKRKWYDPFDWSTITIEAPVLRKLVDNAPKRFPSHPVEVFPKSFRQPGIASRIQAWVEADGLFNVDQLYWVPEEYCPHLGPNLKERIKEIAEENALPNY